jgi:hypothetical protein
MTSDEHTAAIRALQSDVADIKGTLNNGLRAMVQDQRTELVEQASIDFLHGRLHAPSFSGDDHDRSNHPAARHPQQ